MSFLPTRYQQIAMPSWTSDFECDTVIRPVQRNAVNEVIGEIHKAFQHGHPTFNIAATMHGIMLQSVDACILSGALQATQLNASTHGLGSLLRGNLSYPIRMTDHGGHLEQDCQQWKVSPAKLALESRAQSTMNSMIREWMRRGLSFPCGQQKVTARLAPLTRAHQGKATVGRRDEEAARAQLAWRRDVIAPEAHALYMRMQPTGIGSECSTRRISIAKGTQNLQGRWIGETKTPGANLQAAASAADPPAFLVS